MTRSLPIKILFDGVTVKTSIFILTFLKMIKISDAKKLECINMANKLDWGSGVVNMALHFSIWKGKG